MKGIEMSETKFKVGDVLKPVLDNTNRIKLHVIEILRQTCPSMIEQTIYRCRTHTQIQSKLDPAAISRNLFDFNEIEVELWKE